MKHVTVLSLVKK